MGGFVDVICSSPKHIVVAPPGDARTRVEGLDKLMSVLMRVLIFAKKSGRNLSLACDSCNIRVLSVSQLYETRLKGSDTKSNVAQKRIRFDLVRFLFHFVCTYSTTLRMYIRAHV